jgi:hypothetical protein
MHLLLHRLAPCGDCQWIHRIVLALVRLLTTSSSTIEGILGLLDDIATQLSECLESPLSQASANAALIVRRRTNASVFIWTN